MAKLRGGTAALRMETGRWGGLKREERLCKQCRREEVEDEEHFLLRCEGWTQEREVMTECVEMQVGEICTATDVAEQIPAEVLMCRMCSWLRYYDDAAITNWHLTDFT